MQRQKCGQNESWDEARFSNDEKSIRFRDLHVGNVTASTWMRTSVIHLMTHGSLGCSDRHWMVQRSLSGVTSRGPGESSRWTEKMVMRSKNLLAIGTKIHTCSMFMNCMPVMRSFHEHSVHTSIFFKFKACTLTDSVIYTCWNFCRAQTTGCGRPAAS